MSAPRLYRPELSSVWRRARRSRTDGSTRNVQRRHFSQSIAGRQQPAGNDARGVEDASAQQDIHAANGPKSDFTVHRTEANRKRPRQSVRTEIHGRVDDLDPVWLRDACTCPSCVDTSGQKLFETSQIPLDLIAYPEHFTAVGDRRRRLRITWENDIKGWPADHHTLFNAEDLRLASRPPERNFNPYFGFGRRRLWNREQITQENLWVDYEAYMNDDKSLYTVLRHLHTHGLVFIRGIPDDESQLQNHITARIGPFKKTFYGDTWNVKSIPDAKNIAYTHQYLGLHMDLLYMTNPPHLQFLHSLRARAAGGESMFSDAFNAASTMLRYLPEKFQDLTRYPVTWEYNNDGQWYNYTRPTIEMAKPLPFGNSVDSQPITASNIFRVNWSPPFQARMGYYEGTEGQVGPESNSRLREFVGAAKKFSKYVNSPENMFEYRLQEGECVIFDNRRVLHARRAFDNQAGERWLKGAYIDDDVYYSRLRVLRNELNKQGLLERGGTQAIKLEYQTSRAGPAFKPTPTMMSELQTRSDEDFWDSPAFIPQAPSGSVKGLASEDDLASAAIEYQPSEEVQDHMLAIDAEIEKDPAIRFITPTPRINLGVRRIAIGSLADETGGETPNNTSALIRYGSRLTGRKSIAPEHEVVRRIAFDAGKAPPTMTRALAMHTHANTLAGRKPMISESGKKRWTPLIKKIPPPEQEGVIRRYKSFAPVRKIWTMDPSAKTAPVQHVIAAESCVTESDNEEYARSQPRALRQSNLLTFEPGRANEARLARPKPWGPKWEPSAKGKEAGAAGNVLMMLAKERGRRPEKARGAFELSE